MTTVRILGPVTILERVRTVNIAIHERQPCPINCPSPRATLAPRAASRGGLQRVIIVGLVQTRQLRLVILLLLLQLACLLLILILRRRQVSPTKLLRVNNITVRMGELSPQLRGPYRVTRQVDYWLLLTSD